MLVLLVSLAYAVVKDADQDGVPDADDLCLNSQTNLVDSDGCDCEQKTESGCTEAKCCSDDNNPCTDDCSVIDYQAVCGIVIDNTNYCGENNACYESDCYNTTTVTLCDEAIRSYRTHPNYGGTGDNYYVADCHGRYAEPLVSQSVCESADSVPGIYLVPDKRGTLDQIHWSCLHSAEGEWDNQYTWQCCDRFDVANINQCLKSDEFDKFGLGGYPLYSQNGDIINNCQECGCSENEICQENGNCVANPKLLSKYSPKEAFLISDKNWSDVLQLVPLTTWTEKEIQFDPELEIFTSSQIKTYPTLIYHEGEERTTVSLGMRPNTYIAYAHGSSTGVYLKDPCSINNMNLFITQARIQETSTEVGEKIHIDVTIKNCNPQPLNIRELRISLPGYLGDSFSDYVQTNSGFVNGNSELNKVIELEFLRPIPKAFDADSIIYFMQQYNSSKLTIIGDTPQELDNLLIAAPELGAGLSQNNIQRVRVSDFLSYWKSFSEIVYVEDDYELALLASTYASFIGAPLVIQGSSLDISNNFQNKTIICVGSASPPASTCSEQYNLEQLQQKYFDETNTNKLILVNPDDLNIQVARFYRTDKSENPITELYSKTSLASPILASAKHELIIPIKSRDYQEVDNIFTTKLNEFYSLPSQTPFLTIIASPDAIPMLRTVTEKDGCSSSVEKVGVDGRVYGSLINEGLIDLPVGRIMGISASDVSGYIARDIFFDDLPKNKDALLVVREDHQDEITSLCTLEMVLTYGGECFKNERALEIYARGYFWTDEIRNQFDKESFYSGHSEVSEKRDEIFEKYDDNYLLLYADHAGPLGFEGMMGSGYLKNNKIYLQPSLVIGIGCATCKYSGWGSRREELFCVQGIRRGALAQQGAVDVSYWHQEFDNILRGAFIEGKTIGEAYRDARNEDFVIDHYNFCTGIRGDPYYVLLGDPTWKPKWW